MNSKRAFTLIELMIVIAVVAEIALTGILGAMRAANERNASNDYTNEIAGLHWIGAAPIRMIELSVALADADTRPWTTQMQWDAPGHRSSPKAGYWFQLLEGFEISPNLTQGYSSRNMDRFGAIAYPDPYGSSGRLVFMLSEAGTMIKKDPGALLGTVLTLAPQTGVANTGAVLKSWGSGYGHFPFDPMGVSSGVVAPSWSKMD